MNLAERDCYRCYYCGLRHRQVEAGGVYGCPNVFCEGPGAAWFRARLDSYQSVGRGRQHTVDVAEWAAAALRHAAQVRPEDGALADWIMSAVGERSEP